MLRVVLFGIAILLAACSEPRSSAAPAIAATAHDSYQILSSSVDPNKEACCNHIVGEVKNTGGTAGHSVRVVATLYDDSGRVVGTENDLVSGAKSLTLAPGETAPFSIMVEKSTQFSTYKLQVSEN